MKEKDEKEAAAGEAAKGKGKARARNATQAEEIHAPEYYLNRELTWLAFNRRVLHEAEDNRTPLLERLKFLAIVSLNIDEFFMKRIGGLKVQASAGLAALTIDGRTPQEQILECYDVIRDLETRKRELFDQLSGQLATHGIAVVTYASLDGDQRSTMRAHYIKNIFPLVTPQAMDPAHPFPFVSNLSLNLLVGLHYPDDRTPLMARLKVPISAGIPRFHRIGAGYTFVPLEEIIANNLDLLFPGMAVDSCDLFRVTRNAITESNEEQADDLLAMIESELIERRFAPIVRLQVAGGMSPERRESLAAELDLDEDSDVFELNSLMGMRNLMELATLDFPALRDPSHYPAEHPALAEGRNIFQIIREHGSILLHHPYNSFASSVERFLREAAVDPVVRAIKMTLYRTSAESAVLQALIDAARREKQVVVVVELKARFDEGANIEWASRLEEAGIHVTYGVVGLKTHCKTILVVRQDADGLRRYAHLGTGNYHAGTARLYSDLGMLTCDEAIGEDLTELFNYLTTGFRPKRKYNRLLVAPKILKQALVAKIEREIERHSEDSPGLIQMKMNALEDAEITGALYRASQAGVRVDLIVRDTCRLRPQVPGLSENVRVLSIIGRFLEHARIFYFRNGGKEEYYIGSADCMKRNLESRVESVVPVMAPALQQKLRRLLDVQLADRRSAWEMQPDGTYIQRQPEKGGEARSSQAILADDAEAEYREATRLRKRKPKGIARRQAH